MKLLGYLVFITLQRDFFNNLHYYFELLYVVCHRLIRFLMRKKSETENYLKDSKKNL